MQIARLDESQAGVKISRRNINNLIYADDTILMAESKEELEPLDECERGEWKGWLKTQCSKYEDHGIQSHHFMAIDGGTMETVTDFTFWAPKSLQMVTAAMKVKDAYSLEEDLWET